MAMPSAGRPACSSLGDGAAKEASPPSVLPAIASGSVFRAPYPFTRETDTPWPWKPGVRFEAYGPDDQEAFADAIGSIILRVVDVFKPGHFPSRVFFVRQWQDPAGNVFGKVGLRIATLEKFRRLARGYRHEFRLAQAGEAQRAETALAGSVHEHAVATNWSDAP